MRRSRGSDHPVARRVAMASMTVLAASGVGLVAAPMAFGQILVINGSSAGVTNSGSASANTGGNTAVGNSSTNTATSTAPGGGLLNVPVNLGGPTNTSTGDANVTTGPATAVGNDSDTQVGQSNASGTQVSSFLARQGGGQSAGVTNAGSAGANTGGNEAVGNASTNTATVTQNVSGGLIGVGINLGGPTNNSTGSATINTGEANAVGNSSSTDVGQVASGGGGGAGRGAGPCSTGRFTPVQSAEVVNRGDAQADTGNNTAVGNASTNNAAVTNQAVTGGLLGIGLTIGGPTNNSSGTAAVNTGPANAVGNESTTTVSQVQGCPQVTTLTGRHSVVVVPDHVKKVRHTALARTGLDTGDMGMIAGALVGAGMLLVASQRRRLTARHATAPSSGFGGLGLGADDWDRAVR